jgi:TRAP-type transport system periplasmic protein
MEASHSGRSIFLCICLIGWFFLTSSAFAQTKPISLTYSTFLPAVQEQSKLSAEWASEIEKRTGGKVKITIYWGGMLTPPDKSYDGVVKGISDFALSAPSYTKGRFPLTEAVELPLGSKNILSAPIMSKMINEYYNKFKPKEFDDVKVMYFFSPGAQILHTKKPVNKLEDFKGMKIRSNAVMANTIKALSGVAVVTPMSEAYEVISRGVAEGTWCPLEALDSWKLGEMLKYTTECYRAANASSMFVVMNKNKWNALGPENQKIIEKVNEEWIEKTGRVWDNVDKTARQRLTAGGHKFIALADDDHKKWGQGVTPLIGEYINAMKAKGLPGQEAVKFCADYLETH